VDIGLLGFLASLRGWCFGKGCGYRALGDIWSLPKAAIWGKVVDIELWGFQAPPGGCYFGKGCGYRAFGIFGYYYGKLVGIVGLLGFLAPPLCLPTSGWDLKPERPNILETSYTKAHFTLGVRAEKTWGQL
jgi:hypothetical protein